MSNVKILDCTLRDGGYVNNWDFGYDCAKEITNCLNFSGIDYIETGFLKNTDYIISDTVFNEIYQVNNIIPENCKSKILAMLDYGKFSEDKLVRKTKDIRLDGIRVTFKKQEFAEVIPFLKKINLYGYDLFLNPTHFDTYTDEDIFKLIEKTNEIKPYAFSIVDTIGVMREDDVFRLYNLIDNNLDKDIVLCFHSHNNLQLSFANAQCLIKNCTERKLIIDTTVSGMGRGAGNLSTELLIRYLNDNYCSDYDITPILKIVDEYINPIFQQKPWGYSLPYYLSAIKHCHPNYAKYLSEQPSLSIQDIDRLLDMIPAENKSIYDADLIQRICSPNIREKLSV